MNFNNTISESQSQGTLTSACKPIASLPDMVKFSPPENVPSQVEF